MVLLRVLPGLVAIGAGGGVGPPRARGRPAADATPCAVGVLADHHTEFGGCYDAFTNSVRCAFNSTYCAGDEIWKTPAGVAALGDSCGCDGTPVGSCYDYVATHIATCHAHRNQCPDDHSWTGAGYQFADGSECLCTLNRNAGETWYGACWDAATSTAT